MKYHSEDFLSMVSCGFTCGLNTLEEAYFQMSRHYDLFWKLGEANGKVVALGKEVEAIGWEKTIAETMGDAWMKEEQRKEDEYFKESEEAHKKEQEYFESMSKVDQDTYLKGYQASMPLPLGLEWDAPDPPLGQVDDDFPLGKACGLEHEECESCT